MVTGRHFGREFTRQRCSVLFLLVVQKGRENGKELGREGTKAGKRNAVLMMIIIIILIPQKVKRFKKFHGNH